MQTEYLWSTAALIQETRDAVTIVFETGAIPFKHKAGQYINLNLTIDGISYTRSYSLSSCPDVDEKPAITVKRVEEGIVSNYILEHAEDINEWNVAGPFGRFYIDEEVSPEKPYVFVAGGSGITPIYSMVKHLLKNTDASVLLVYCNRTIEDVIYSKSLHYLEDTFPCRFYVYHIISKAVDADGFIARNMIKGRLSKLVLKKTIKNIYPGPEAAVFYLCGPAGLIALAVETIKGLSLSEPQVYKEFFQPAEVIKTVHELPTVSQEVLLHYYEQSNLLEVSPGESILDSALNDRIPMRHSCKAGTCGVCKGKLLSGNVHIDKNFALTDEELNEGYILLCQSYPLNNEVTVVVEY